jgi:hypothetical protein
MEVVPVALVVRRDSTLTPVVALAALVVAAVLVPAGSAASRDTVLPTLYVAYAMNCTFAITDDGGRKVGSIAPGTYQVLVTTPVVFAGVDLSGTFDMTACKSFVQFQLTGPGVDLSTTLQEGDEDKEILKATFQASSTYTAQDLNQAAVTRLAFATAASGSPTAPSSPSTSSTSSGKGTSSTDIVGSATTKSAPAAIAPLRGTLAGAVNAAGKLTLTKNGKGVTNLKAGRYTFTIQDGSAKADFTIQALRKTPVTLTGVAYVGTHRTTVTLKPGQWTFYSYNSKANYFIVIA